METEGIARVTVREIRAEMARYQLTQHALAKRLGWTQPYLSRRLMGHVPLSLDDVEAIAAELDVPIRRLTKIT